MALLHRVKERKAPSLSAQASFTPFSLKVAWSGNSLIGKTQLPHICLNHVGGILLVFKQTPGAKAWVGVRGSEGSGDPCE